MKLLLKNKIHFLCLFWVIAATLQPATAQQNRPFWNEIQDYRKQDSLAMPAAGGVVFIGSSSLRMWKDLEKTFKQYNAVNRGFGGSNLVQANDYSPYILYPYKPRQVVVYSGENDIAEGASAAEVLKRFDTFFTNLRKEFPGVPVVFISIKPSPSREKFFNIMHQANTLIKTYLGFYQNTFFVDVFRPMLDDSNRPRKELFLADMLHMNADGYAIWINELTPYLMKK